VPIDAAIALTPVLAFLAALQLMDSFKLVPPRTVLLAILAGGLAALACEALHGWLLEHALVGTRPLTRYVAPVTEETLKALLPAWMITRRRIGFLVDAAVVGFAVGTGFALVENVTYLRDLPATTHLVWLVRGVGTAVLHGATMAIFAMVARTIADRRPSRPWRAFVPGWLAAVAIHSAFNHVPLPPVAMALLMVIVLPPLVVAVFTRSERETREWVGAGLDLDVELLSLVGSEAFAHTRFGTYLRALGATFPGEVVADMYCLLRLQLELSVQAKAMLLARDAGLQVPEDPDLEVCLAEVGALEASIGPTGRLALEPLMVSSHRDDWHRHLLSQKRRARGRRASGAWPPRSRG
jgi:RsiW-degrading membrane proteinase PrsW (M82 family)